MMLGITTAGVSALRPGSRKPLCAAESMKRNLGLENEGFIYVCVPLFYDHLALKVFKQLYSNSSSTYLKRKIDKWESR